MKKNLRQLGLNYKEFLEDYFDEYGDDLATLRGMLKEEDEYQAAMYYFLRLDALYVKYDFKEGKWTNPPKWVFASDPQYSFRILAWTKDILSILGAELRRKR